MSSASARAPISRTAAFCTGPMNTKVFREAGPWWSATMSPSAISASFTAAPSSRVASSAWVPPFSTARSCAPAAFLGAGSLVTEGKELEGGYLWMGRPAKRVRELTAEEKAWFEYSARHYVNLKNDYLK